jgi:hypothetical protein
MGLQKFRADEKDAPCANGAVMWYARWMGGPSLSKIENCPTPFGPRTVYIRAEPDTFFSQPAACSFKGRTVHGFITFEDHNPTFHAMRRSWVHPHVDADEE